METFPEPTAWLASRLSYGRTAAVMSMVGFILGSVLWCSLSCVKLILNGAQGSVTDIAKTFYSTAIRVMLCTLISTACLRRSVMFTIVAPFLIFSPVMSGENTRNPRKGTF